MSDERVQFTITVEGKASERLAELRQRLAEQALRYPVDRPGWLGMYQPWPCGRCGREVDDSELHACLPDPASPAAAEDGNRG